MQTKFQNSDFLLAFLIFLFRCHYLPRFHRYCEEVTFIYSHPNVTYML